MIERMTSSQTIRNFLADLQLNSRMLDQAQQQVSTGKRLTTPADDPLGLTVAMQLRSDSARTDAWQSNITDSLTWIKASDTAFDGYTQVIQRARELAVQGANGSLSASARATLAKEVDALTGQMVEIGNSSLGGRYLFGGTKTQTAPFDSTTQSATLPMSAGTVDREVGPGNVVSVNVTAGAFQGPGGSVPDIFATLKALSAGLTGSNVPAITATISQLDAHLDNVSALRGGLAGKQNQLEMAASRLETTAAASADQLSKVEDADMASAITNLTTRESLYRSALGVGGRVLQPSLLDFLR